MGKRIVDWRLIEISCVYFQANPELGEGKTIPNNLEGAPGFAQTPRRVGGRSQINLCAELLIRKIGQQRVKHLDLPKTQHYRTLADVRVDLRRGQREGEGEREGEEGEGDTEEPEEPEREGEGGERSGQTETAPAPRTQLSATPIFKILQRTGDLLQTPEHIPIAHCISADYALGAGVAKQIRDKYGVEELNTSVAQPGDCIKTTHGPRQIYHLVTKWWCRDLPTYEHLETSLIKLCYQCKKDKNKILAIPKLGCGLDKLDYTKVKEIIEKVFKEGHIQVILLTK
ncbi:uncharacterized protein [Danio rerio]|uniref:Macro domain-containing protein n=1 Tax=Danio rerio TaxID=7955 RepID=A0AB32TWD2_DANRE